MEFEFSTSTRIIFGSRMLSKSGRIFQEMGSNVLIISNVAGQPIEQSLVDLVMNANLRFSLFHADREPTDKIVQDAVEYARKVKPDFVIGFGGGSAIDTAKAVSALYTNPGGLFQYLEVVGEGKPLLNPPIPLIAIPTTAGTGSEVTRNAVIEVEEPGVKVSLRSALMYPKLSLIDPELAILLPPEITASTGLDALTQLIEPFVSNKANPLTDAICREGIKLAAKSLRTAYLHGDDLLAREDMALASLFGGLALANAKLGAVHGFAGPLGGVLHAAHGAICASLLPQTMETNLQALIEREPESLVIGKFTQIAQLLTRNLDATAQDGIEWVRNLCAELDIPKLGMLGLNEDMFDRVIDMASEASSMAGNPIKLTESELLRILNKSI